MTTTSKRLAGPMLVLAALSAGAARAKARTGEQVVHGSSRATELPPQQAMLWKYTPQCALHADQELTAPAGPRGAITGAVSRDAGLEQLEDGSAALYRHDDFGSAPGKMRNRATGGVASM